MKSLRARISINSSPSDVFQALLDFNSYREWNPWLTEVEGEAIVGTRVQVKPNMISLFGYRLTYHLVKIQEDDFLRWEEEAWFSFLFRTVREYQVYTKLGGSALYSVRLSFLGPLAPIVGVFYGPTVRRGLRREAEALKVYCESKFPLKQDHKQSNKNTESTDNKEDSSVNLDSVSID